MKTCSEMESASTLLLTGSFDVDRSAPACQAPGVGYLYGLELLCGDPGLPDPDNPGSTVRRIDVGEGLPTRPRVSLGGNGTDGSSESGDCTNMVVVINSEGEAYTQCPGTTPTSGVRLKAWRDFK